MKNLLFMSMFGLFMVATTSGQSLSRLTIAAPAYATEANNDNESDKNDNKSEDKSDSKSGDKSDSKSADKKDSKSNNDEASNSKSEFHCPDGITTCYRADGSEYIDVNNLAATAAGSEGNDDDGVSVVKPTHFRSF